VSDSAHSSGSERRQGGAIWSSRAWVVLLVVTLLGVITDLGSKSIAFHRIAGRPVEVSRDEVLLAQREGRTLSSLVPVTSVTVIPSVMDFTLVLNPGAVFGIGAGKRWFFIAFTGGALALAIWMFASWTGPRDYRAHAAIGLLISGGLGNLYDRIVYACVRDFLHPLPGVKVPFGLSMPLTGGRELWPYVSNLADLWLLIGIGMLMWYLWRAGKAPTAA
jgi:signal peptidase II